jgi:hypothetical protein
VWNFETSGITVPMPDGTSAIIFAKLGCVLADEAALKSLWSSKGASGINFSQHVFPSRAIDVGTI